MTEHKKEPERKGGVTEKEEAMQQRSEREMTWGLRDGGKGE